MSDEPYTFEQVAAGFVAKAARYAGYRYGRYGVTKDDAAQEIYVWLYGEGRRKVESWLEASPQRTTRIYRSMLDVAIGYGEREKATAAGYSPDDVYWYSPSSIEGLMPLVVDPTYTRPNGAVDELLAMVLDIRRVLSPDDIEYFIYKDEADPSWRDMIRSVVDRLGGSRPYVGRRKALSNAAALAITKGAYDEAA